MEESPSGYAHHKIICDKMGNPCDYMFIEVNKAFETITGIKGADIIGKTITEILPGIEKNDFDWIACYGEIVLKGEKKEFEQYFKPLNKWFKVMAYAPEKNTFITIFSDISTERKQINAFHKLSIMSEEFLQWTEKEIDYQEITDNFLEIADAKFATFNLYDEDGKEYTTMAISGDKGIINKAIDIIGLRLNKKKWLHDPVRAAKIKDKMITRFPTLHDLAGDVIPLPVCNLLTKTFKLGEIVLTKIMRNNIMLGDFTLIMSREKAFDKDRIVEIFTRQLGLFLTRMRAEDKIKNNQAHLNALISNTPAVIYSYTIDPKGVANLTYINDNVTNVLGFKPTDFIGNMSLWANCVHPEDMPKLQEKLAGKEMLNEYRFKDKNGDYHWLLDRQNLYKQDNGLTEIIGTWWDITERKEIEERLKESDFRFNIAVEGANTGVWDWDMIKDEVVFSTQWKKMLGYQDHEVENSFAGWKNLWHPDDASNIEKTIDAYLAGKTNNYEIIHRCRHKNGDWRWLVTRGAILKDSTNKPYRWIGTNVDITELKKLQENLEQEQLFSKKILDNLPGIFYLYTYPQLELVRYNKNHETLLGYEEGEIAKCQLLDWYAPEMKPIIQQVVDKAMHTGQSELESSLLAKNGQYIPFLTTGISFNKPEQKYLMGIGVDLRERKKIEKEIEFLSYNDQLTGLYNRRYYEQKKAKLDNQIHYPLALIMADVNGLKLTNDAFGHQAGDLLLQVVSNILKGESRETDIVARIGGDEFVLLLPQTDAKNAELIIDRINTAIKNKKIDNVILSISLGYAVKKDSSEHLDEIFMKAENDMYQHKLSQTTAVRSKTIELIKNTLFEKNNREKFRSQRVGNLCQAIAEKMNFTNDEVKEIKTAGQMLDIGKIGINETILNKPDKLTDREWKEIKRHSEIGYRILCSANEFSQIANYILEHHEKWDGTGYPKGLKGNEISLQARIIALADAYDAMTNESPYKKAISEEAAIAEIKQFSGTQFDPDLVKLFIEQVLAAN